MVVVEYRDSKGEFRWHLQNKGRIIAESGEGYKRIRSMRKVYEKLFPNVNTKRIAK